MYEVCTFLYPIIGLDASEWIHNKLNKIVVDPIPT
jgi:hypothetical protein